MPEAEVDISQADSTDLTTELKRVFDGARRALDHDEIRSELGKMSALAVRLKESPNYYYTVIHRLVSRGEIVREGKKYRKASEADKKKAAPSVPTDGAAKCSGVTSAGEFPPASVQNP